MSDARIFTLEEAQRTLPLLRRILTDLRNEYRVWKDADAEDGLVSRSSQGDPLAAAEVQASRRAVNESAERIEGYMAEIDAIGCVFRGFDAGLVDFYTLRDDRLVFLCWRVDEEQITHWHEIADGYAGRQPIDSTFLTTVGH
ncbi:MAG: DUF2203 domain-containing protein [Gemmatimonadales bacterium]|nr:DUF2203 domain-containing protein [Gemmatimonadales bacterium]